MKIIIVVFLFICSQFSLEGKVKQAPMTKEDFLVKVNVFQSLVFEVSYYKARLELEDLYHGAVNDQDVVFLARKKDCRLAETQYKRNFEKYKQEVVEIGVDQKVRFKVYEDELTISYGPKLIGLFIFVKEFFPEDLPWLIKSFDETLETYKQSQDFLEKKIYLSWIKHEIFHPTGLDNNLTINWERSTIIEYVENIK